MARYIDVETALKIIDNYAKTVTADGIVVVKAIRDIVEIITPTADVVPKNEVERLQAEKDALIKNYAECMKDYASEIFAEIERIILDNTYPDFNREHKPVNIWKAKDGYDALDELKKKYTEGEDKPAASEEKYFSPGDVAKMTHQEVREKYSAIRRSMERW